MAISTSPTQAAKREHRLFFSTTLVVMMTMFSRVLGFIRDMVIAHFFGAVAGVDAFFVAFKIPNFMRRLFAEGAFSQAFVPVLSEYQQKHEAEVARTFISHIAGTLATILFCITLLAVLITPFLVLIFAPGFIHDPTRFQLAVTMLRITFPYLLFIALTAMAGGVLNTYGSFGVPALTPVLLNMSLIVAALYLAPLMQQPVVALAWGVFVAGIAQLLFQLPFLWKKNLLIMPRLQWHDPGVKRVMKLMVPALFGVSVAQINLLLDTLFASFLQVGSISWLYFSDRLMNFPLGVFGVAISTVILPTLSRNHAEQSTQSYSKNLDWALRTILLIAIPAAIGLLILGGPLLTTLFNYGQFTDRDVRMARLSLIPFSIGVPAFMLTKVLASAFYAKQNIKTPVKVGVIAMLSNMILNLILIFPLAHAGLALATSISACLNAGLLFYLLQQRESFKAEAGWVRYGSQLFVANFVMIVWLFWQNVPLSQWFAWMWFDRVFHLAYLVLGAIIFYLLSLLLLGVRAKDFRV